MNSLSIAVVEDDPQSRRLLCEYLRKAAEEENLTCSVTDYSDGEIFLNGYTPKYDLIFLDIELPIMNGLKAAQIIRKTDKEVGIIFVTRMAQYALNGYEVNAIDYIVKPITYESFVYRFRKALSYCTVHSGHDIVLEQAEGLIRIPCREIYYLEKDKNYIIYHTGQGEFKERGTMSDKLGELAEDGFSLCNSGCLVNLRHVQRLHQSTVWVNNTALPVSRGKWKAFTNELIGYMRR